jgi:MFS family permease
MSSVMEHSAGGSARADNLTCEERVASSGAAPALGFAERRRAFAILFASLVCMGAGQSMIFTILPSVARRLTLGPFRVTCIFAVSALIWVFSSTYWGARSDRHGRKPIMLLGLSAFAISFVAFATTMLAGLSGWMPAVLIFPLLIASRCIYGGFGSGTSAAAQAYIADRTSADERLSGLAIISMAFALGTTIGPVIGSGMALLGPLAPFYAISALALVSAAAVYLFLPERTAPKHHRPAVSTLKWHERRIFPFAAFGLFLSMIASVPIQTVSFFFMDILKKNPQQAVHLTGVGLTVAAIATLFGQFVIVQRSGLSARALTSAGLIIAALSNALFFVAGNVVIVILALVLSGLGFGLARPGFTAGASLSVRANEQGAVAGVLNAAGAAGFIFGPIIGWLYEISPYVPYTFGAVMMLALLAAQYLSPVLRHAGEFARTDLIEEGGTETPLQSG